jgi:hypothetical protein
MCYADPRLEQIMNRWLIVLAAATLALAQGQETYKTRLSPVPIDAQLAPTVTGHGAITATLSGTKLTVTGSFEDMRSAATAAHLCLGKIMPGVRGAPIHELTVAKAMGGNISGSADLTTAEVDALRKGWLYVQVDSAGAKEGNLWGWLLK